MKRVLSLFAGIGGFDLGLERTGGFKTVAFCEIDPFCQRVLAKHWPDVPIHRDVRELKAEHVTPIDVICGGFPCQDISLAGKGEGLAGKRSGLWFEYARLIGELRPRYVIVENVAALLGRGMGVVLGDLAGLRYDAEWRRISARDVGAPHLRQRIWIVAYPGDGRQRVILQSLGQCWGDAAADAGSNGEIRSLANSYGSRGAAGQQAATPVGHRDTSRAESRNARDANSTGLPFSGPEPSRENGINSGRMLASASWWATEPDVGRVAHGVPSRVDRLRGLGNAVVPQIPEIIGRAILAAEAAA